MFGPGIDGVCGVCGQKGPHAKLTCGACGLVYDDCEDSSGPAHSQRDCIEQLQVKISSLRVDHTQALANLTSTQERCTQLLNENRDLRSGLNLDGWFCSCAATDKSRGIFNSDAKERRSTCRSCGAARPT